MHREWLASQLSLWFCIGGSVSVFVVVVVVCLLLLFLRYEVVTGCWSESPDKRPSFEDLSQAINSLLEGVAGYMDFSAFSNESARAGASGYGVGSGCNHLAGAFGEPDCGQSD